MWRLKADDRRLREKFAAEVDRNAFKRSNREMRDLYRFLISEAFKRTDYPSRWVSSCMAVPFSYRKPSPRMDLDQSVRAAFGMRAQPSRWSARKRVVGVVTKNSRGEWNCTGREEKRGDSSP
jgi:hypothetical protein